LEARYYKYCGLSIIQTRWALIVFRYSKISHNQLLCTEPCLSTLIQHTPYKYYNRAVITTVHMAESLANQWLDNQGTTVGDVCYLWKDNTYSSMLTLCSMLLNAYIMFKLKPAQ